MIIFSRWTFVLAFTLVLSFLLSSCKNSSNGSTILTEPVLSEETVSGGQIYVMETTKATIHTYIAPDDGFFVTTQIIETENGVVIVDGQFLPAHAAEVQAYVDTLGKPILRIIVTHGHPDHFTGLAAFDSAPVYATAGTTGFIAAVGQTIIDTYMLGVVAVIPTDILTEGTEVIDGLSWEFKVLTNAEAEENVVALLPELDILIAQDLVYNGTHIYIDKRSLTDWKTALGEFSDSAGYEVILAGHGAPTTPVIYADVEDYLTAAEQAFSENDSFDYVLDSLATQYPERTSLELLQIGLANLYGL